VFDFNGTLSDDEPIMCELVRGLLGELGRPLSAREYYDELAGLSDPEIVRRWLGRDYPDVDAVVAERVARYRAAVVDGSTVGAAARGAVGYAAARVPVGVVSGAARAEIEPVLAAAGVAPRVQIVVSADDVVDGKPHPEGYLLALELFAEVCGSEPRSRLSAGEVVVFEDTEAGIAAASAAGMRCVAVEGTERPDRLAAADVVVPALDVAAVENALSGSAG
jgi:beta-phosphoglucomutase-like phosphatase (HAD superfamily)